MEAFIIIVLGLVTGFGLSANRQTSDTATALVVIEQNSLDCGAHRPMIRVANLNTLGSTRWVNQGAGDFCDPVTHRIVRIESLDGARMR